MAASPTVSLADVEAAGIALAGARAVFLSGSLAAGWTHALSDVDLYVVDGPRDDVAPHAYAHVGLDPPVVPIVIYHGEGGRRWDVEYWLDRQVEQLLAKIATFDVDAAAPPDLVADEIDFVYRLSIGVELSGGDWLAARQDTLAASAIREILALRAFDVGDGYVQDAVGQLEAGDVESAVLSARLAFGATVDGLLAVHGQLSPQPKWRARKLRDAEPEELSFEEFWSVETMRDFDPADPAAWVRAVVRLCQDLMLRVDVK